MTLKELCAGIQPASPQAMEAARIHWAGVAKPLGGLGLLEEAVVRMAGCQHTPQVEIGRKAVVVFCADNGVVAQGVTQTGQEVTAAVARAMAEGRSCVCHMANIAGAAVIPVDIGMAQEAAVPGLCQRAVRRGTADFSLGPAMELREAEQAICIGAELAMELARQGVQLLATGEMGIGNTTSTAAVAAVLLGLDPAETVGTGAGLSSAGLAKKRAAVARALAVNCPDAGDPLDVLCKVGGLDIAGMAGLCLGGAQSRIPVLLDGAISCAAGLLAIRMCPAAAGSLLASHRSSEPVGGRLLEALELSPLIDAHFHLGEGTGAVAAMPMLDMALAVYHGMSSFDAMGIAAYTPQT